MHKDAILLIGFGAPEKLEDLPAFLEGVVRGQKIPPARVQAVVEHYRDIGGGSPFNKLTLQQAAALRAALDLRGRQIPVYVGMRNWHPYLKDVVRKMADDGAERAVTVIMAPHQGPASWGKYEIALAVAMQTLGARVIPSESIEPWFGRPKFIEAIAARVAETVAPLSIERQIHAAYILTAHSVPVDPKSPYEKQIRVTADRVAEQCDLVNWSVGYQSRSGNPAAPWLGPDVLEEIKRHAATGVRDIVLIPIGFLCDHVEVLYDLDIEARKLCEKLGVNFFRAKTVGSHPKFIDMLADLVVEKIA